MCGIFATIGPKGSGPCEWALRGAQIMKHRGPDAQGALHVELSWCDVTLGMSRLKIVDQSDIPVPYDFREHLGIALAYNGEVYNWQDIRKDHDDVRWRTRCDAEVVAAEWRRKRDGWRRFPHRLNGMWGVVLVDVERNLVHISRDRAGEKPLYYAERGEKIHFASEIKALPVLLEETGCDDMGALEFDFAKHTPFREVFAVEPGQEMTFMQEGRGERRWWRWDAKTEPDMSHDDAANALADVLANAIEIRNVAEVPVAVQLSGGLDSAIIQAVVGSDNLYCVDFQDEGVDNLTAAMIAARGKAVRPVTFTRDELLAVLPEVAFHLDTPATWTAVCQWFMNRRIAADDNVVVLSGEGADELFGGYARYRILYWLERMKDDPHLEAYQPLMLRTLGDPLTQMLDRSGGKYRPHARKLVKRYESGENACDRMAHVDFYTTMQVLLRMADRMAAAFSLENRSPLLDYRVMDLAAKIPSRLKVAEHESKSILRSVAARLGVPNEIVCEKTKKGLFVPAKWGEGKTWDRGWFRTEMESAWKRIFFGEKS